MFVESYFVQSNGDIFQKKVNREVKFWARNGRRPSMRMIFFDVKINKKFYFFSYFPRDGSFYFNENGVQKIGKGVPRVYYLTDGLQFCVTAKGRLWVKQL